MNSGFAVALGIFDGLHLGHRAVIEAVFSEKELKKGVFTFKTETVPCKGGEKFEYIYTSRQKKDQFKLQKFDRVYSARYNDLKDFDGETFCREILCGYFNAKKVFCGYDFRFGKDAAWGTDDLKKFGEKYDFETVIVEPVTAQDDPDQKISSSSIKVHLKNGNIEQANVYLGEKYMISGEVMDGKHLGRRIGFPTINQYFEPNQVVPRYGVYSSQTDLNGKKYRSITNIGIRPTVSDCMIPTAETHIIDFAGDLYRRYITVRLESFVREEKKFNNIGELKTAIEEDIRSIEEAGKRQKKRRR